MEKKETRPKWKEKQLDSQTSGIYPEELSQLPYTHFDSPVSPQEVDKNLSWHTHWLQMGFEAEPYCLNLHTHIHTHRKSADTCDCDSSPVTSLSQQQLQREKRETEEGTKNNREVQQEPLLCTGTDDVIDENSITYIVILALPPGRHYLIVIIYTNSDRSTSRSSFDSSSRQKYRLWSVLCSKVNIHIMRMLPLAPLLLWNTQTTIQNILQEAFCARIRMRQTDNCIGCC